MVYVGLEIIKMRGCVCLIFVVCRDSGSAMPRGISIPILPTFGIVGEVDCEHVKDVTSNYACHGGGVFLGICITIATRAQASPIPIPSSR